MKKPSIFQPSDMILAVCAVFSLAVFIYVLLSGAIYHIIALFGVVAAVFIAFFLYSIITRVKFLSTFTWYPELNLMVQFNEYEYGNIVDYLNFIIERWQAFHPNADVIIKGKTNWVFFIENLDDPEFVKGNHTIKGLVFVKSRTAYVDFNTPTDKIENTAFAHEIGHIIRGNATGQWNQDEHHEFFVKHNLGHIVME